MSIHMGEYKHDILYDEDAVYDYVINNGRYVISFSDSNFKYNSFGYSFGFLVKYTL